MTELMTHVESIVRPVRGRESWKLRTRRELLSHLQASYDEELSRGLDPAAALDRAKSRLGDAAALTRQLQQSAPLIDRVFLSHLPAPRAFDAWEAGIGRRFRLGQPLFSHALVAFLAAAIFPYVAAIFVSFAVERSVYFRAIIERPLDTVLFNLAGVTLMAIIWVTSARYLANLAAPAPRARAARYGLTLVACYVAITFICISGMGGRLVTPADLARTLAVTATLLLALALTARLLAAHRRPYDEWLTLDVAP